MIVCKLFLSAQMVSNPCPTAEAEIYGCLPPFRGNTAHPQDPSMGRSKRHAGFDVIDTAVSSHTSPRIPEENRLAAERIERSSPGNGADPYNSALPEEWARVSALALKHLDRCVALEPKVLQGDDPNAIHDLRVAARRAQQVFQLIYPTPQPGEVRKLLRGLKRSRRALSEIRNYDVLLERVDAVLSRKRTARREAWEAIREHFKQRRSVKLEKALRKLAKANLSAIYVHLKECLPRIGNHSSSPGVSNPCGREQELTVEQFSARISESLDRVWKALEQQIVLSHDVHTPAVLHRTRIAAKRARYLIEVIHAFGVPGSKEALIWLRSLQTRLGDWHDLVVFEEAVIEMIADPAFLRDRLELAMQIERLIMRNRAWKSRLEQKYFEMIGDKAEFNRVRKWARRVAEAPAGHFARA
jgi:CHAD domain-containing protein